MARSTPDWSAYYSQINAAALARYPELLFQWFPAGHLDGREFCTGSLNGEPGKSLKINIDTGVWCDFATGEPGGGDPISVVAARQHLGQGEAGMALGREMNIEPPKLKRAPDSSWRPITPVPAGLFPRPLPKTSNPGTHEHGWVYRDPAGRVLMYRVRFDQPGGKDVLPLTWCEDQETGAQTWRWKDLPAPRPLCNLDDLAERPDAPVLVVEGEKCLVAAAELLPSWVVTCWPGGTNRCRRRDTDWTPLAGRKVWIWPDNDDPGKTAALTIANDCLRAEKPLIVKPDSLWPVGHDIADLVEAGWDAARLEAFIATAVPAAEKPLKLDRIPVDISSADLDEQSRAIWAAVAEVNSPPSLFASPYGMVVVDRDLFGRARTRIADIALLRTWLVQRMAFFHVINGGHQRPTRPDEILLITLLTQRYELPLLNRVAEIPTFTPDCRLIDKEGFDAESGVYYLPTPAIESSGISVGTIANFDDAQAALMVFDDLVCDFPFLEDCDYTHALAFAMLPIVRMTIAGQTPLFRFEAPTAGTGKSRLMRMLAKLTSTVVSEMSPKDDEEEWRKSITSSLSQDPDAILIDNAERLESAHLKKLLTDDVWEERGLGTMKNVRYPVRAIFGVSLNNPLISREIIRRSLRVRLDARMEHPESRTGFRHKAIEEYAIAHRGELVQALVTLAQYGLEHGDPDDDTLPLLGSYEAFSRRMGAIMRALGREGFLGDRQDESMLSDEEIAARTFVQQWGEAYVDAPVKVDQLIDIAIKVQGFYLGKGDSKRSQQSILGRWLSKRRGSVFGNWKICERTITADGAWWRLKKCV